jgi:hypothetical protein
MVSVIDTCSRFAICHAGLLAKFTQKASSKIFL